MPHFLTIMNNAIMLVDLSLKPEQAKAINNFLLRMMEVDREHHASYLGSYRIDQLVLDSSLHTDEALAALLSNLTEHRTIDNVSLGNCRLGPKSMQNLIELAPKLTELRLSNLQKLSDIQSWNLVH